MSVREIINQNRMAATIGAIALTVLMLGVIIYTEAAGNGPKLRGITQLYYTDDDGATWYADQINIVPPYTNHNGKKAVRAYVFQCKGGEPFVAYLEEYTPQAKAQYEAVFGTGPRPNSGPPDDRRTMAQLALQQGRLVKKPLTGDHGWVRQGQPGFSEICQVQPPAGQNGTDAEPVYP